MLGDVRDCIWGCSVNIFCFQYDVIWLPFWIFFKITISQNKVKTCYSECSWPELDLDLFFSCNFRSSRHFLVVFLKWLKKKKWTDLFDSAWPPEHESDVHFCVTNHFQSSCHFVFSQKPVKIYQKCCIIGSMTEQILFAFAIVFSSITPLFLLPYQ